jgi:ParB-like chromosome segregation protein Spo0J
MSTAEADISGAQATDEDRFFGLLETYVEALKKGRVDESMIDEVEAAIYEVADEIGVDRSRVDEMLAAETASRMEWRKELPDRLQPVATHVLSDDGEAIADDVMEGRYAAEDVLTVIQDAAEQGFIDADRESRLTDEALDASNEAPDEPDPEQDVDAWLRSIGEEFRQTAAKRVIDGNEGALTKHHDADTALWAIDEAAQRGFISTETDEALREAVTSGIGDGDDPSSIDVQNVPLDEVHTDEDRFQPRGGAFSEETARRVAEDYDPALMDPIDLWRDPGDAKLYVLAGYSRLEGFRRRGADTIPAVIKDEMTEEQAIRYALVENDKSTNLTNAERAGVVRRMRESGELATMKEQREFAQDLYDRNASVVFDLSWLDPKGKAIDVLTRLEGSQSADYRDAETMAQWVGKMMRLHRDDFTRQHENEMFDFLLDNYKTEGRGFTSFPEFRNYVEEAKNRAGPMGTFDEDDRLNLEQVRPQSQQEREIDRQVQEAKEELRDAKRELDERRSELLERMQREAGVTREDVQRALDPLEERVQAAQQDLIEAKEQADRARSDVQQSQMSLMDAVRENPEPLVYLGRCRQLLTDDGTSYRGSADFMFSTPGMDALIIVPAQKVERREDLVDDEEAEEAYEEWHHFEADDTDFRFRLDNFDDVRRVGTAQRIRYTSDKVMRPGDEPGDDHDYYHDFRDTHAVYEVPQDDEGLALLVGAQAHGDTIEPEGTLEIDGRGILN